MDPGDVSVLDMTSACSQSRHYKKSADYTQWWIIGTELRKDILMATTKDDRIFQSTQMIAGFVIFILVLASIILYIFPQKTDVWFSWTVKPGLMSMLMGAGYLAGAFFFLRVFTSKSWHQVQLGFLPITLFTILMFLATLLHWDRFHHGTWAFYLWTAIYAITPFLIPFLWWRNRVTDPGVPETADALFSNTTRWILACISAAGLGISLLFFVIPTLYIGIAPWVLTPLTARVGAGWAALAAATVLSIASDRRWSGVRYLLEAGLIGVALMLLAFVRAWTDLNPARPMTWAFLSAFALLFIGFGALHLTLDARSRQNHT
jgi:hypothetical protein